ncbi:MAG: GYDIA family GHMP kinase [Marinilabilia sp.]
MGRNQPSYSQTYHSNGKLLLAGEYLVLHGALALAAPLNRGQSLQVQDNPAGGLQWEAFHPNGHWFSAAFDDHLNITRTDAPEVANNLKNILHKALEIKVQNPDILSGFKVGTTLEFDPAWGWGSSSTLISNLAMWLKIDPYQLLERTFGGSGYDIACAKATSPLFYRRQQGKTPEVRPAPFAPSFEDQLWVVYLNKKQISSKAIESHQKEIKHKATYTENISRIAEEMTRASSPDTFMNLMNEHENLISRYTGLPKASDLWFPDFPGAVKSLGAWGGDFILALSHWPEEATKQYFQTKGHQVLFKFTDIKSKQ